MSRLGEMGKRFIGKWLGRVISCEFDAEYAEDFANAMRADLEEIIREARKDG